MTRAPNCHHNGATPTVPFGVRWCSPSSRWRLMMSVDSTIVATALHALQHGLETSINWAAWTLTAYSSGFVLMLPISGRLSERYGHRRVFVGSVIAFTVASLCCGLVDDIFALIALRAVQAAGGPGFTPSATGIIVDHFGDDRDRAVSLFGSIFPIGAMIGPLFGGLFVSYWTWRGVFFVNVPIGVAVIVLAMRYVPQDRPPADKSGFWRDGATIASGMLFLAFRPSAAIPPYVWLTGSALLVGAGAGAINPASRNAGLQLAPRHSSTLAALRSASLQIGSIVTVSIVTAILAGSDDPGRTQARVFVAVGLLLVAALPLIRRVPDQRGAW